jgi:hypothetical protein
MLEPQGKLVSVAYVHDFVECEGEPGGACEICGQKIDSDGIDGDTVHPNGLQVNGVFASKSRYGVGEEIDISKLDGYDWATRDCGGVLLPLDGKQQGSFYVIESAMLGSEAGEMLYGFGPKREMEDDDALAETE